MPRDTHDLERERLWPRVWQMACREADLPTPGDFVVYDILDDSILVVRTGPGSDDVTAMYNVCQHRGRRLCDEPRGHIGKAIRCRFHGWQYDRTGALTYVHFEEDWRDCTAFDKAKLGLPRVAVGRWGGWIWIHQDPHPDPLEQYLTDVARFLDPFAPADMRPLWWKTIVAPANWKVLVGAFIEAYHSRRDARVGHQLPQRACPEPGARRPWHAVRRARPVHGVQDQGRTLGDADVAPGEHVGEFHPPRPHHRRDDAGARSVCVRSS